MRLFSGFIGRSEERPPARPDVAPATGVPLPAERDVCIPTLSMAPGMRLAQPVYRADGAVLLPGGTELDLDQLRRLIQRGIECAHVLQKETRDAARIEQDVAIATARVAHLFRGDGSAARKNLGAAITAYRRQAAS